MKRHDDEDLYRTLVEGDIAETAAAIRSLFARRPDLEREWAATKAVQAELAASAREKRAVLASAEQAGDAPGLVRAEQALLAEIERSAERDSASTTRARVVPVAAERPHSARELALPERSARPWYWIAAAAALLVCFALVWNRKDAEPTRDPGLMLGDPELATHVSGDRASGTLRFEWTGPTTPGLRYRVTVEGASEAPGPWQTIATKEIAGANGWTPPAEVVATWPVHLKWSVVAIDASTGGVLQSGWQSLSPAR